MTYLWAAVQNLPFSGLLILFVDNIRYSAICKSLCSRQNNIDFEHSQLTIEKQTKVNKALSSNQRQIVPKRFVSQKGQSNEKK